MTQVRFIGAEHVGKKTLLGAVDHDENATRVDERSKQALACLLEGLALAASTAPEGLAIVRELQQLAAHEGAVEDAEVIARLERLWTDDQVREIVTNTESVHHLAFALSKPARWREAVQASCLRNHDTRRTSSHGQTIEWTIAEHLGNAPDLCVALIAAHRSRAGQLESVRNQWRAQLRNRAQAPALALVLTKTDLAAHTASAADSSEAELAHLHSSFLAESPPDTRITTHAGCLLDGAWRAQLVHALADEALRARMQTHSLGGLL